MWHRRKGVAYDLYPEAIVQSPSSSVAALAIRAEIFERLAATQLVLARKGNSFDLHSKDPTKSLVRAIFPHCKTAKNDQGDHD
jgi:hypothetical protein